MSLYYIDTIAGNVLPTPITQIGVYAKISEGAPEDIEVIYTRVENESNLMFEPVGTTDDRGFERTFKFKVTGNIYVPYNNYAGTDLDAVLPTYSPVTVRIGYGNITLPSTGGYEKPTYLNSYQNYYYEFPNIEISWRPDIIEKRQRTIISFVTYVASIISCRKTT